MTAQEARNVLYDRYAERISVLAKGIEEAVSNGEFIYALKLSDADGKAIHKVHMGQKDNLGLALISWLKDHGFSIVVSHQIDVYWYGDFESLLAE